MRKLVLACLLSVFCVPAWAACEGRPALSAQQEFRKAAVVAWVQVVKRRIVVDETDDPEGYEAELFDLAVKRSFKGKAGSHLVVYNHNSSGRFPMALGEEYLAFVKFNGDFNVIDSCGHSVEWRAASALLKQLGR